MIHTLAERHGPEVRRGEDGELMVPGKNGHLYEYDESLMGLCLSVVPPAKSYTSMRWGYTRNACVRAGMILHLEGDFEGILLFDPTNKEQARLAIKQAGVKRKRKVSDETRKRLQEKARTRQKHTLAGELTA